MSLAKPRWYAGRLWLLESGQTGYANLDQGDVIRKVFLHLQKEGPGTERR
jgi:hypothetical protein